MKAYKRNFLELSIKMGVLKFGEFTLKSGRNSPYFFNAGLFNTGYAAAALGQYYADAIIESGIEFDMILGRHTKVYHWPLYQLLHSLSTTI